LHILCLELSVVRATTTVTYFKHTMISSLSDSCRLGGLLNV
jgi:hypothetical protein